jgi:hypothetical protein
MAIENTLFRLPFEAAEDLSDYQYHFVKLGSTKGQVALLDAANDVPIGVLQNEPASGEEASVMIHGVSKVKANALIGIGTLIMPEFVSTTDCGKAQDAGTNWAAARGVVVEASGAENDLASVLLLDPKAPGIGRVSEVAISNGLTSAVASAATLTLTAAQLLGGYIRATPTEAQAMTLPTAALLYAAMPQPQIGSRFEFTITNLSAYTITVGAGTGGTLTGTATIATANSKRFLIEITAATPTYTCWSLGTAVH